MCLCSVESELAVPTHYQPLENMPLFLATKTPADLLNVNAADASPGSYIVGVLSHFRRIDLYVVSLASTSSRHCIFTGEREHRSRPSTKTDIPQPRFTAQQKQPTAHSITFAGANTPKTMRTATRRSTNKGTRNDICCDDAKHLDAKHVDMWMGSPCSSGKRKAHICSQQHRVFLGRHVSAWISRWKRKLRLSESHRREPSVMNRRRGVGYAL